MKQIGILAYGSLIDNPGTEIEPLIDRRIEDVVTPFRVEFARSSQTRGGAPTLIPVDNGGSEVTAQIIVLKEGICEKEATNMLWRRETRQVDKSKEYRRPCCPTENTVLVERLETFHKLNVVLYTRIGSNIRPLTPQRLAQLAIDSAKSEAGAKGCDGINYLMDAKRNGIRTPLMLEYEKEILRRVGVASLEEAFRIIRKDGKQ